MSKLESLKIAEQLTKAFRYCFKVTLSFLIVVVHAVKLLALLLSAITRIGLAKKSADLATAG
jgi:hypothetical protein